MAGAPELVVVEASTEQKIDGELTQVLFRSAGFGLFSTVVLAVVLVAGCTECFPLPTLLAWLGAVVVWSAGRGFWNHAFRRAQPPVEKLDRWRRAFFVGSTASALLWGLAGWRCFENAGTLPRLLGPMILTGVECWRSPLPRLRALGLPERCRLLVSDPFSCASRPPQAAMRVGRSPRSPSRTPYF